VPPDELIVRPLRSDDNVKALSLGLEEHRPLKTFLKKHAWDYERCSVARTHVLVGSEDQAQGGRVWGYVTLTASEVATTKENKPQSTKQWPDKYAVPAIKLARMAIDKDLQKKGHGSSLLDFVVALVNDHVRTRVGCRLLVTDAKQSAVSFYSRHGFTMLDTPTNKERDNPVMFILLNKLVAP
jgi:ribosomal protein S18 acetylase RimI-like enzyme